MELLSNLVYGKNESSGILLDFPLRSLIRAWFPATQKLILVSTG